MTWKMFSALLIAWGDEEIHRLPMDSNLKFFVFFVRFNKLFDIFCIWYEYNVNVSNEMFKAKHVSHNLAKKNLYMIYLHIFS